VNRDPLINPKPDSNMKKTTLNLIAITLGVACLHAGDWSQWGGANSRNMVSSEKGLPADFSPGKKLKGSEEVDMATTKNCLWVAKLGSQSYGTPNVANGQIFVGTNNEVPRNTQINGDRGIVMVFDEKTGKFQWQMVTPKLGAGKVSDWEFLGMCSTPTIVGDRGYLITNRCEIVCISTKGLGAGNLGMQDEAKYMAAPDKDGKLQPGAPGPLDADIIWVYDMRKELGVFPHNIASNYPLVVNGKVYAATSNGVDWSHSNIPAPQAPSFVCVDAETGKYVAEIPAEAKISEHVMHCNWSSPSYAEVGGKPMVIFAAGDGFVYGLGTGDERKEVEKDVYELPIKFKYDAVPKDYRFKEDGTPKKYAEFDGPSELIATPVVVDGKCYVAIGQDPEHGEGVGMLSCIDISQTGDISGKALWTFKGLERTIATPAVKDGIIYAADYTGRVFALDAGTGKELWKFDTKGHIWASPVVADGKVYIGNEEGELFILAEGKEKKELGHVEFPAPIKSSVVPANGVLYVTTETHIYAFKEGAKPAP
jgi:outer membrane protein assembly factor BamB